MGEDLAKAQERMIVEQLLRRGISDDRVLEAMRSVPRHRFVPAELAEHAYDDGPLPIGESQTISQPYIVALICQIAELGGNEKVLEVGTGSGYQAAVLSRLAAEVRTVECIEHLCDRARIILQGVVARNVQLRLGDGSHGWPEEAPFDRIVVTAAMPGVPIGLLGQLKSHGRLIAPIGERELQTLVSIRRVKGRWQERYFGECRFVRMTGKYGFTD